MGVLLALCLMLLTAAVPGVGAEGTGAFARIDAHAAETPPSAEETVSALAGYLARPAKSDLEKARALFRWITLRVDYDTDGFRSGSYGDLSPDGVLRRRKAVCSGYAALFERLAAAAGLEAVKISGYSKGYGFTAGARLEGRANHAWNAVKIDGQLRLLDCTWGAGHVTPSMEFERKFAEHYFLTPPEEFLYDHFPEDPKWQLVDRPVTREEYERLVYLRPGFFRCRLAVESHRSAVIEAEDTATVTFAGPDDALLLCTVMRDGEKLERPLTLTQREDGKYVTRARFPGRGDYVLRFFAKQRDEPGPYSWALDYKVVAARGPKEPAEFPKTYGVFQERGVVLTEPMTRSLKAGESRRFSLQVPGADAVAVVVGKKWTQLKKSGDRFEGEVPLQPGPVQVCARLDPEKRAYSVILEYEAK